MNMFGLTSVQCLSLQMPLHALNVYSLAKEWQTRGMHDHVCAECLTAQMLLHLSDLSNLAKEWSTHVKWSHAILAEFYSQVRKASCSLIVSRLLFLGKNQHTPQQIDHHRPSKNIVSAFGSALPHACTQCSSGCAVLAHSSTRRHTHAHAHLACANLCTCAQVRLRQHFCMCRCAHACSQAFSSLVLV